MAEQSSADFRGNLGRYALYGEIAAGGMATVHIARLLGSVGFARTVAIKRLHPHLAKDPEFVAMFLEEARLAARVRHPNVVATLDVVSEVGELFLVMEYVAGESLSRLVRKAREAGTRVPPRYTVALMSGALDGLHAAHEATSEKGQPLGMVHRDVSPQNIHCGIDGVARVLDFGIAKATNRVQETRTDQIKGKVAYMSPEQLAKGPIDRRADVYSASVVLWEALTGQRLFKADDVPALVYSIMNDEVHPPSSVVPSLPKALDAIVMRGLDREAARRWSSAHEMAAALERALSPAPPREIGGFIEKIAGEALAYRMALVHRIESETSASVALRVAGRAAHTPLPMEASGVVSTDADAPRSAHATGPPPPLEGALRPPADSVIEEGTLEHRRGHHLVLVATGVVALLLIAGGVLLGMRWMQLQTEGEPDADAPAPAPAPAPGVTAGERHGEEGAIVIGVSRPAGSNVPAASARSRPAAKR